MKEGPKYHETRGNCSSNRRLAVIQRASISEQRFPRNSKNGLVGAQKWAGRLLRKELMKFNKNWGARSEDEVQCLPQISKDFEMCLLSNGK